MGITVFNLCHLECLRLKQVTVIEAKMLSRLTGHGREKMQDIGRSREAAGSVMLMPQEEYGLQGQRHLSGGDAPKTRREEQGQNVLLLPEKKSQQTATGT